MAQEPTADLNGTFEVTENEDAEITKSIQASLLVQAPLQVRFRADGTHAEQALLVLYCLLCSSHPKAPRTFNSSMGTC